MDRSGPWLSLCAPRSPPFVDDPSPSQDRRRLERGKKQAKEDAWRDKYNKEERKKKYIVQGQTEKRKALQAQGKFASRKKAKTGGRDD